LPRMARPSTTTGDTEQEHVGGNKEEQL
jgi:hypothetical protein